MTLTEYFKNPHVLTNAELSDLDAELESINRRMDELNPDNCDDDRLLEFLEGRLDAIVMITEHSLKLAKRKESGLRLIKSA